MLREKEILWDGLLPECLLCEWHLWCRELSNYRWDQGDQKTKCTVFRRSIKTRVQLAGRSGTGWCRPEPAFILHSNRFISAILSGNFRKVFPIKICLEERACPQMCALQGCMPRLVLLFDVCFQTCRGGRSIHCFTCKTFPIILECTNSPHANAATCFAHVCSFRGCVSIAKCWNSASVFPILYYTWMLHAWGWKIDSMQIYITNKCWNNVGVVFYFWLIPDDPFQAACNP